MKLIEPSQLSSKVLRGSAINILLAACSGLLTALSFPPCEYWWIAWVCLVPLFIALRRTSAIRASGWLGMVFGIVLCCCSLHWMTAIFGTGAVALFVLASLFWAVFGVAYRVLCHHRSPLIATVIGELPWQRSLVHVLWVSAMLLVGFSYHENNKRLITETSPFFKARVIQDEMGDLDQLRELTLKSMADQARLVVWPELAVSDYPLSKPSLLTDLEKIARASHGTLVLGCKEEAPQSIRCDGLRRRAMQSTEGKLYYNAALVLSSDGTVLGTYHKTHPIQFFSDGVPGRRYPTFNTPCGRIGIAICYDFDFASTALNLIRNGAELLVVPTFDAMEWTALQHTEHSRMAQARAAEVGRYVVRATSSGISQIIAPNGTVTAAVPNGESGSACGDVRAYRDKTPYVEVSWMLPWICVAISLLWLVVLLFSVLPGRKV